jgi:hypothetical protein
VWWSQVTFTGTSVTLFIDDLGIFNDTTPSAR